MFKLTYCSTYCHQALKDFKFHIIYITLMKYRLCWPHWTIYWTWTILVNLLLMTWTCCLLSETHEVIYEQKKLSIVRIFNPYHRCLREYGKRCTLVNINISSTLTASRSTSFSSAFLLCIGFSLMSDSFSSLFYPDNIQM